MKTILVVLALMLPVTALAQAPASARIQITSTLSRVHIHDGSRVQFHLLWNKSIRNRPIGHAFHQCQEVHSRALTCTSIFTLPLGKITTMGEVRRNRYTVVVTGGSGYYLGAIGVLNGIRISAGTYVLSFRLQGLR